MIYWGEKSYHCFTDSGKLEFEKKKNIEKIEQNRIEFIVFLRTNHKFNAYMRPLMLWRINIGER